MKILMLHRGDGDAGGAQVQMNRLRGGLKGRGVDARVLCREKLLADSVVLPFRPRAERWLEKVTSRAGLNDIHLISSFRARQLPEVADAELIDLHCLHSGTFSYLAIPSLAVDRPVVFTLHDMWALTGHCHASLDCTRWKTGCGKCPYPDTDPVIRRDATALEWRLKRWACRKAGVTVVTPSRWLHDLARESMLGGHAIHHIPHGVDPEVFKPLDKDHCRNLLGIPPGKLVLLCAMEDMRRPLKGADLLVQALERVEPSRLRDCVLLFFGKADAAVLDRLPLPVMDLGYLHDDASKAMAYSAADLAINPTRAESFGLVILESMACGLPVVSFAVGGVPELVRHGVTGHLAEPGNPESLAAGIGALLGDPAARREMSRAARDHALSHHTLDGQVERYLALYRDLIDGHRRGPT